MTNCRLVDRSLSWGYVTGNVFSEQKKYRSLLSSGGGYAIMTLSMVQSWRISEEDVLSARL
uniref:Uncharacterized protein n=1 Tax=Loa loa TaxID=7209 RepID=A0A1I7V5G6_LOALO